MDERQLLLTIPLFFIGQPDIQAQHSTQKHPNLLIIITDQWRGQALGYLGIEPVKTPNIDRLAHEGIAFNNAISNIPLSSPARGMLMTGLYPFGNGVTGNCVSTNTPYGVELKENARCWSDILKAEGYSLGYIGKWHLDAPFSPYVKTSNNTKESAWNEWCPPHRRHGFDYWISYGTYDRHLRPMYWNTEAGREDFFYVDQWGPEYEADQAIEYINNQGNKRKNDQPFALVVSMNPPHTGYNLVPEKYRKLYENINLDSLCTHPGIPAKGQKMGNYYRDNICDYYACMTGVDEQVGRITDALKKKDLANNTIVVFTSDHGNMLGIHEQIAKNIYYEESVRIPLIISWPGQLQPRQDNHLLIGLADLYPTLLSFLGLKDKIPTEVQTYDLAKTIQTGKGTRPKFQPYYQINVASPEIGCRGIRDERYTFVAEINKKGEKNYLLFDRQEDPYQLTNIATQKPKLVKKYLHELRQWLKQTNDPAQYTL